MLREKKVSTMSEQQPSVNPESTNEAHNEKLTLLIDQSFPAASISVFVALVLMVILWDVQTSNVLLTWYTALVIAALSRFTMFYSYRKTPSRYILLSPAVTKKL